MTSPLQRAYDAAGDGQDAAPPVVCTVAGPRVPFSAQVYTGAELRNTSTRPGAYDAMAVPSLLNGRRVARSQPAAALTAWTPPARNPVHTSRLDQRIRIEVPERQAVAAPTPKPAPRVRDGSYLPNPGSVPSLVLAYLTEHGGHLTYVDVSERFGLPKSSVLAVLKKALDTRLLMRLTASGRSAFALPGYVAPPDARHTGKDVVVLQDRLAQRRAEVARLERELAELLARAARPEAATT